jgi:dTDP-4-amino-4,6-dideoxygalactose transaminase
MKVPFLDLKSQYLSIKDEIQAAVNQVLENTAFAGGPFVAQFERQFAEFCGCKYVIGVGSGTDALWLTLLALGIGEGDEVITVPNTFIATAEAISFCGATPVFVDIDDRTLTMDPNRLEDYLKERCKVRGSRLEATDSSLSSSLLPPTSNLSLGVSGLQPSASNLKPRPKAVIPVHLFGQPADMDSIVEIARRYNLFVIEDSCQAHGAEYKGKRAGSIGIGGCFSFYPGKNLGAYGEAGAIVTNNDALADKVKMLRDHGQGKKYYHDWIGWNARMDGFQGGVLTVKLKYLSKWNEARRDHARIYNKLLGGIDKINLPVEAPYARHIYHIYAIQTPKRDGLISYLGEKGISCGIHYPVPVHLQKAYSFLKLRDGGYPVTEKSCAELVSLPMYPELSDEQIEFVCNEIKDYLSQSTQRPQR